MATVVIVVMISNAFLYLAVYMNGSEIRRAFRTMEDRLDRHIADCTARRLPPVQRLSVETMYNSIDALGVSSNDSTLSVGPSSRSGSEDHRAGDDGTEANAPGRGPGDDASSPSVGKGSVGGTTIGRPTVRFDSLGVDELFQLVSDGSKLKKITHLQRHNAQYVATGAFTQLPSGLLVYPGWEYNGPEYYVSCWLEETHEDQARPPDRTYGPMSGEAAAKLKDGLKDRFAEVLITSSYRYQKTTTTFEPSPKEPEDVNQDRSDG